MIYVKLEKNSHKRTKKVQESAVRMTTNSTFFIKRWIIIVLY